MSEKRWPTRILRIEAAIAKAAGISIESIRSDSREQVLVDARAAIWYIANKHLDYPFVTIARLYDKDRTTVMHGVAKLEDTAAAKVVVAGLKKVCPSVFSVRLPQDVRSIEEWKFE